MRKFFTLVVMGLAFAFGCAHAQTSKPTPPQDKAATCDKAAGNKKGDERAAFIKICMAVRSDSQPDKMATCDHARAEDL